VDKWKEAVKAYRKASMEAKRGYASFLVILQELKVQQSSSSTRETAQHLIPTTLSERKSADASSTSPSLLTPCNNAQTERARAPEGKQALRLAL
jgi:hypothetical protein